MRILYLHYLGIEYEMANLVQVKSMCSAMAGIADDVTLSLPGAGNVCESHYDQNQPGSYTTHFRKKYFRNGRIDKYLNYFSIKNTIYSINPDVCYLRSPLLLRQVLPSNRPVIIELHNNKLYRRVDILDRYWRKILKKAVNQGRVRKVVCISGALSEYWISEGIPKEKVMTAHDGFDKKQFNIPIESTIAKKDLGYSLDKKIITYTGSLYKDRNIENILKLAEVFRDNIFIIVGGPEELSKYYRMIAEKMKLDNIYITGRVPHKEIPKYLFASDVLLALWSSKVPTINYCSPLKIFEYMASGRTIVAHGFPTIREVLKDGINSIICEPDSMDDLVNKLQTALQLPSKNKLSENARKDAFRYYSWDTRAKNILDTI